MNLGKKKNLAAKTLGVGKNRVLFDNERLSEIKEAITKQDIRDLYAEGIIKIKEIKGRKTIKRRKTKRGPGKIRKHINKRKQEYVKLTRKLREYSRSLLNHGTITKETYRDLRKKIKMKTFRSKAYLKDYLNKLDEIGGSEKTTMPKAKKTKKTKGVKK